MSIELCIETFTPERQPRDPLPVKRVTFESRRAVFRLESNERSWDDMAVQFYVGPLGMWLQADEAEALGKAMIACAKHYRAACKAVTP